MIYGLTLVVTEIYSVIQTAIFEPVGLSSHFNNRREMLQIFRWLASKFLRDVTLVQIRDIHFVCDEKTFCLAHSHFLVELVKMYHCILINNKCEYVCLLRFQVYSTQLIVMPYGTYNG